MRDYLEVAYDPVKFPPGRYPSLLAELLLKRVYSRTGTLLDLGCGRGDHLDAFAELGFDVTGIDASPAAPHILAANLDEVEALPVAGASMDFVFSKAVIEHLRSPMLLLDKALTCLRPGGVAVVMTPSWEHIGWGPFYGDCTHVSPFTRRSLAMALEIAGFDGVEVSYFRQLPFLWRVPFLLPLVELLRVLHLPYRPYRDAWWWPERVNKLIRFSGEVMLLGVGRRPKQEHCPIRSKP